MATAEPPRLWVLDTNVVLDLIHWNDPGVAPLAAALRSGVVVACTDESCLKELELVLARPEFLGDAQQAREHAAAYRAAARLVASDDRPALPPLPRCKDPDDQKFLELARTCGAELLVTKDKALLALARRKHALAYRIATPAAALRTLGADPVEYGLRPIPPCAASRGGDS